MIIAVGIRPSGDVRISGSIHRYTGGAFFAVEVSKNGGVAASTAWTDLIDDKIVAGASVVIIVIGHVSIAGRIDFDVVDRFLSARSSQISRIRDDRIDDQWRFVIVII